MMFTHTRIAFALAAAVGLSAGLVSYAQQGGGDQERIEPTAENISYAIGYRIGKNYERFDVKIEPKALAEGLRDQQGGDARLSEKQVRQVLNALGQKIHKQQQEAEKEQSKNNRKAGEQFLKTNRQREDVTETASGLQYKVLEQGQGQSPGPRDKVKVHYTGELLDGTVFDSSRKRGEPISFRVNRVIEGWSEALQMMKPGARYKLWIPADLAYGDQGQGQHIEPGDTLVFDVKLLSVQ